MQACTKCLRRDKAGRARTSTLVVHLEDVFKHRWDASSPFFAQFDGSKKARRPRKKKGAGDEDEEAKSHELQDAIDDLLCEEWQG